MTEKKIDPVEALRRNLVINELLSGLTTDGAHHKQYYLEKALQLMTQPTEYEDMMGREQWQKGIAP